MAANWKIFDAWRFLTVLLAALALLVAQQAAAPATVLPLEEAGKLLLIGLLPLLAHPALAWWSSRGRRPFLVGLLLAGAMVLPVAMRWTHSPYADTSSPIEMLLLQGIRNVAFVGAVFCVWPAIARVAVMSSTFVVLFAFVLVPGLGMVLGVAAYAVLGALWLMMGGWPGRCHRAVAGARTGLPRRPVITVSLTLIGVVLLAVLAYPSELTTLQTIVARWGGIRNTSPGDKQVGWGKFSLQQTLEEFANGKYGEAAGTSESGPGAPGATEQAASLGSRFAKWWSNDLDARKLFFNAGEGFSLIRQGNRKGAAQGSDNVLFETEHPLMRHVPVANYERFDGTVWQAEAARADLRGSAEITSQGAWMTILEQLKLPNNPDAIGDGKKGKGSGAAGDGEADDSDLIEQARAMVASMAAGWTGDYAVLEPKIRELDSDQIRRLLDTPPGFSDDPQYLLTPYDQAANPEQLDKELQATLAEALKTANGDPNAVLAKLIHWRNSKKKLLMPPEVSKLVNAWIAGEEPGWSQIQAVIAGLRKHCQHDPEAVLPRDEKDPTSYFLLHARRGPDYLFASTAAVLLRSLGYPSRMVGGYYVDPHERSWWSGRTQVRTDDVHYWTQVRLVDGTWVNLEPTPGYELPSATPESSHFAAAAWEASVAWSQQHRPVLVVLAVVLATACWLRRWLGSLLATWIWSLRVRGSLDRSVLATWRLLELRAHRAGCLRPKGTTLAAWYTPLLAPVPEAQERLDRLARLADWATHAPGGLTGSCRWSATEIRQLCREAVRLCSIAVFRQVKVATVPVTEPSLPSRTAGEPLRPAWPSGQP